MQRCLSKRLSQPAADVVRRRPAIVAPREENISIPLGAEESLRMYRLAVLAGASLSHGEECAAVRALQQMQSSQWNATCRVLRMVAAEKGVDIDSGLVIPSAYVHRRTSAHSSSAGSAIKSRRHPAWNEGVRAESPEERLHMTVQHDMAAIEASHFYRSPPRAAQLVTCYALHQIRSIMNEPLLGARVLPWTLAMLARGVCSSGRADPDERATQEELPPANNSRTPSANKHVPHHLNPFYAAHMQQRLAALEHRMPARARDVDAVFFLTSMCPGVDELLLGQLANALFSEPPVPSTSPPAHLNVPNHLKRDRLHQIFPRVVPPTSSHAAVDSIRVRLDKIVRRTMRGEVSQGVLVPDASAMVHQFERIVSLSQHREILLPFRVLLELIHLASADSTDWRKYRVRKHLAQLLRSVTTDRHQAPQNGDRDDPGATDAFGGVTLLGLCDELALATAVRNAPPSCGDNSSLEMLSTPDSIAWTAKYVDLCRRNIAASGGDCDITPTDPISILLAGFGVFSAGSHQKKRQAVGRVVVMSRDPRVHEACCRMGVEVLV